MRFVFVVILTGGGFCMSPLWANSSEADKPSADRVYGQLEIQDESTPPRQKYTQSYLEAQVRENLSKKPENSKKDSEKK